MSIAFKHRERGNVIFLILIAIVLFAALAYAVTQTGRTASKSALTSEQARLAATEMLQYGDTLRTMIDKMISVSSVQETAPTLFASTANANYGTPTTATDEVFNPSGGKVPYLDPPSGACLPVSPCLYNYTGQVTVTGIGSDSSPDLAMVVFKVDPNVCQQVNLLSSNGLTSPPVTTAFPALTYFVGAYGGVNALTLAGAVSGLKAFCYQEATGAQRYVLVYVLRAR
jgi:hypothetical protein